MLRMEKLTQIANDELEKFRLNVFSKCACRDEAPYNLVVFPNRTRLKWHSL